MLYMKYCSKIQKRTIFRIENILYFFSQLLFFHAIPSVTLQSFFNGKKNDNNVKQHIYLKTQMKFYNSKGFFVVHACLNYYP